MDKKRRRWWIGGAIVIIGVVVATIKLTSGDDEYPITDIELAVADIVEEYGFELSATTPHVAKAGEDEEYTLEYIRSPMSADQVADVVSRLKSVTPVYTQLAFDENGMEIATGDSVPWREWHNFILGADQSCLIMFIPEEKTGENAGKALFVMAISDRVTWWQAIYYRLRTL